MRLLLLLLLLDLLVLLLLPHIVLDFRLGMYLYNVGCFCTWRVFGLECGEARREAFADCTVLYC